ncbi:uncharacterized protein FIBRA_03055 [Fibroporia radiculosa]|uniref:G domain-containing protein n=1 Tax=Fibroporia radiculosa TaxID=599839 RepID=J4HVS2_9APHY|nr:uncharacterized protein FIBRA_03055 [Fibroporia radiculosa]CCM01007.1 predicted protein [Fibroporia radiculosa]
MSAHSSSQSPLSSSQDVQITYVELTNFKPLKSAELWIGDHRHTLLLHQRGKVLRAEFAPALQLTSREQCRLQIHHKRGLLSRKPDETITLNSCDILSTTDDREFVHVHRDMQIVCGISRRETRRDPADCRGDALSTLEPTTEEILRKCPRFRILVIGRTGVGKSSLIQQVFGIKEALVSHDRPGEANIDTELTSPENDRFILHDSKGFEPGEEGNYSTVETFIKRRRAMPNLKDKLHAVWLCFAMPYAGGRLLEAGVESFLKSRDQILGNIPLIIVFTKYDTLFGRVRYNMRRANASALVDDSLVKPHVESDLRTLCIQPIERLAGVGIPHIAVSNQYQHKDSLVKLVELTYKHVSEHIPEEASTVTAMAQRVDPKSKVTESIAVGKKRYWKALATSSNFKGHTMWDCFHVIHNDIINVWNFHDPSLYLMSKDFRTLVTNMVADVEVCSTPNPVTTLTGGGSFVAAITAAVGALAGPAAPIVVPIAAGLVLVAWVYTVYEQSRVVQQRFMAYIVDLTHIMEMLLIITADNSHKPLNRRAIKLAFTSYSESSTRAQVHAEIENFEGNRVLHGRDDTLEKIESLIQLTSNSMPTVFQDHAQIPPVDLDQDEVW